jgi:hypothetical protein
LHTDDQPSELTLLNWAEALEHYARDWDTTFENKPSYYTQEYWYLFINCLKGQWRGSPLTISQACQSMKTGSQRTREERIKKAVLDGYLEKHKHPEDGREIALLPSEKLQRVMIGHLTRTLKETLTLLSQVAK